MAKYDAKYYQIMEGEWVPVRMKNHRNQCCGCGLVHDQNYRFKDGVLEIKFKINERATAITRRSNKYPCKPPRKPRVD